MKLYIWSYDISYGGSGVVFAVADSEPEARRAVAHGKAFCGTEEYTDLEMPQVQDWGDRTTGKLAIDLLVPDRIIDLDKPYAEWHEWSE